MSSPTNRPWDVRDRAPQTVFISTQPSDADAAKGWRQPRSSFGQGRIPYDDDLQRFLAHPWSRDMLWSIRANLIVGIVCAIVAAVLFAIYNPADGVNLQNMGSVRRFFVIAGAGLYALLLIGLIIGAILGIGGAALTFRRHRRMFREYRRNSTHAEAAECVMKYLLEGRPLALYLRSSTAMPSPMACCRSSSSSSFSDEPTERSSSSSRFERSCVRRTSISGTSETSTAFASSCRSANLHQPCAHRSDGVRRRGRR